MKLPEGDRGVALLVALAVQLVAHDGRWPVGHAYAHLMNDFAGIREFEAWLAIAVELGICTVDGNEVVVAERGQQLVETVARELTPQPGEPTMSTQQQQWLATRRAFDLNVLYGDAFALANVDEANTLVIDRWKRVVEVEKRLTAHLVDGYLSDLIPMATEGNPSSYSDGLTEAHLRGEAIAIDEGAVGVRFRYTSSFPDHTREFVALVPYPGEVWLVDLEDGSRHLDSIVGEDGVALSALLLDLMLGDAAGQAAAEWVYPNSIRGVLAMLGWNCTSDLTGAELYPDPMVDGVWLVTTPNDDEVSRIIVYLAGYRHPVNGLRKHNDFESEYAGGDQ